MAKKTFLSRLMGSDIAEDSRESQITNFSFDIEEDSRPAPQPPVSPDFSIEETYEQEWLPESQGQLTVDVYQTKDEVVIQTMVAGVSVEDIDITIANDKVPIEGERKKPQDIATEDYFYQEMYWGAFSRSIVLPVDVDMDHVEAKMKDGILTIVLPKAAKAKVRKVQVKKGGE